MLPTGFFTYFVPAASGKLFPGSMDREVHCIGTFKNGKQPVFFGSFGKLAYRSMTNSKASTGIGKVRTERLPNRLWAGENTGRNPTDRGKLGTKRSVLSDGRGVPLGVVVSGANTHDIKLLQATFDSIPIRRPQPTTRLQHVYLDKAYDSKNVRQFLQRRHYKPNVKSRGDEAKKKKKNPRFKARRWVVERTQSWINRFRRLLVRWEKKSQNYLAMLQFAFAYTTLRTAGVLG